MDIILPKSFTHGEDPCPTIIDSCRKAHFGSVFRYLVDSSCELGHKLIYIIRNSMSDENSKTIANVVRTKNGKWRYQRSVNGGLIYTKTFENSNDCLPFIKVIDLCRNVLQRTNTDPKFVRVQISDICEMSTFGTINEKMVEVILKSKDNSDIRSSLESGFEDSVGVVGANIANTEPVRSSVEFGLEDSVKMVDVNIANTKHVQSSAESGLENSVSSVGPKIAHTETSISDHSQDSVSSISEPNFAGTSFSQRFSSRSINSYMAIILKQLDFMKDLIVLGLKEEADGGFTHDRAIHAIVNQIAERSNGILSENTLSAFGDRNACALKTRDGESADRVPNQVKKTKLSSSSRIDSDTFNRLAACCDMKDY